jgi:hypothetical protein
MEKNNLRSNKGAKSCFLPALLPETLRATTAAAGCVGVSRPDNTQLALQNMIRGCKPHSQQPSAGQKLRAMQLLL